MKKVSNRFLNAEGQFIVRCSALGSVMASPSKVELSVGALTYVKNAFKETYLGYEPEIDMKQLGKGNIQEAGAIKLLSDFYGENYEKNEERRTNGFIKGECDIAFDNKIRDVKCPWSKKTHPLLPIDGKSSLYEWQGRGYMMLWDKEEFYLDYVLMPTPESLIPKYEAYDLHRGIEELPKELRITTLTFMRDFKKDQQIIQRIEGMRLVWDALKVQFKIND